MSNKVKAILWAAAFFLTLALGFAGLILTDYATKHFWWTFWGIMPYVGFGSFLGLIWYYNANRIKN